MTLKRSETIATAAVLDSEVFQITTRRRAAACSGYDSSLGRGARARPDGANTQLWAWEKRRASKTKSFPENA